jgi:serine/threonine protein kinase
VYKAKMQRGGFATEVAIKLLRSDLDPRANAVDRLRDEASLLGRVRHRAIPRVYDLLMLRGRLALITEYIEGADLDACTHLEPPLSLRASLEALADIAEALHAGWTTPVREHGEPLGLVHRDLKPANIRIARDGTAKLLDYGIAWSDAVDRLSATRTGAIIGSPAYMAPERYTGAPPHPSADLYSLGCVLYEIVTHTRLFNKASLRTIAGIAQFPDRFRPVIRDRLSRLPPDLDPALRTLVELCIDYEPARRPDAQTAATRLRSCAQSAQGPGLADWCRSVAWPDPVQLDAPFVGEILEEGSSAAPVKPSSLRMAPAETLDFLDDTGWHGDLPATPAPLPASPLVPQRMTMPATTAQRSPQGALSAQPAAPPTSKPGYRFSWLPLLLGIGLGAFAFVASQRRPAPTLDEPPAVTALVAPLVVAPTPTPTVRLTPAPATPTPTRPRKAPPASVSAPSPITATSHITLSEDARLLGAHLQGMDGRGIELPTDVPVGTYALWATLHGAIPQRVLSVSVHAGQDLHVHCDKRMKACKTTPR